MGYLVRKLLKRENIAIMGLAESVESMYADAATSEFRSKAGTLSMWRVDDATSIEDAVLAVVTSSSKFETMDFVIVNTDYLDEQDLQYIQSDPGPDMAVEDLRNRHYDVINITIPKLLNCTKVYRKIYKEDDNQERFIIRFVDGEIRDLLKKANRENRIDLSKLSRNIRKEVFAS